MHGLKRAFAPFHVKADGVHGRPYAAAHGRDRSIIIDVTVDRLNPQTGAGEYRETSVGVPRGNPNGETGVVQVRNNAPAEKSGSPENRCRLHGHSATPLCRPNYRNYSRPASERPAVAK